MSVRLRVDGLSVAYGNVVAVRDVTLSAEPGRLLALLGPNGAGKTSLLGAVAGLLRPTRGRVWLGAVDITGRPAQVVARSGLRLVPEGRALFPDLTVWENLQVGAGRVSGAELGRRTDELFAIFPRLAERRRQQAGLMSGGEQQMLSIARALVARPALLLLDEPSMGLAPQLVAAIVAVAARLRDEGLTILVAEQNARAVLPVADAAVLMARGRVEVAADPATVAGRLRAAGYLGPGAGPPTAVDRHSSDV